jgi:hypothetical protein
MIDLIEVFSPLLQAMKALREGRGVALFWF